MTDKKIAMRHKKKIALVAHDNKKRDLTEWAKYNRDLLAHHKGLRHRHNRQDIGAGAWL